MYKLFTDKLENFEAKIRLEGASLKKSKARLVSVSCIAVLLISIRSIFG